MWQCVCAAKLASNKHAVAGPLYTKQSNIVCTKQHAHTINFMMHYNRQAIFHHAPNTFAMHHQTEIMMFMCIPEVYVRHVHVTHDLTPDLLEYQNANDPYPLLTHIAHIVQTRNLQTTLSSDQALALGFLKINVSRSLIFSRCHCQKIEDVPR